MSCRNLIRVSVLCTMLLLSHLAFSQNKSVSGKVTDSRDGTPVAGATVSGKGTKVATQTGADGSFTLSLPNEVTTLVISNIGFATQEIAMEGKTNFSVTLAVSNASLGEVVIIGYGTAKRKDLTGSITTVSTKDFVRGPVASPEQLITGKVAGVQINTNSGEPGVGSRIRIRGGSSGGPGFGASNDPLIVVDGVPLEQGGIAGAPNGLTLINPADIESFNVLKDASATAIYGSRAANGVIIITTKKGKGGGKVRVGFTTLNSLSTVGKTVDVMTANEFRNYVNAKGSATDIALLGNANTDWQDQIYRSAFSTDNNLNVQGGIKNLPYRFSLGYLNQDGILKTSNIKRYAVGLNLNPKLLNDHLTINSNLKYVHNDNFFANTGAIGSAVYFDPTQPIRTSGSKHGGYWEWIDPDNNSLNTLASKNPVGMLEQQKNVSDVDRFIGNVQFDYKLHFFPDLRLNLNIGYDQSKGRGHRFVPAIAASDSVRGGVFKEYDQKKVNKLLDFYVNYVKEVKSIKSRFDIMAGYSYQDWETTAGSYKDYAANGTTVFADGDPLFQVQNTLISFYGRFNYGLMNRYLLTFTMRRDGSSKFSKDNRWGNYPSAAFAWNIGDELFMKNQSIFSSMKLRLGWGKVGQQDGIREYGYQPNYFFGDSAAQYQMGNIYYVVVRPDPYDEHLKWEQSETTNIGLDMAFLKGRLNATVEYYHKNTTDLLAIVNVPAGTNFSDKITTNIGSIRNKGLELTLNSEVIQKRDFSLSLGYNMTWVIESKIQRLQLLPDASFLGIPTGGSGFNSLQMQTVGQRPNTFFLYRQVYDNAGKPIEGLYEDINGDGSINDYDKQWIKNPDPKVFMGFSANATYKQWSGGFVMRASLGNYMYNGVKANSGYEDNVLSKQDFNRNAHSNVLVTDFQHIQTFSDYYLENASFLRMDNIYVGYDFGAPFRNKNIRLRANLNCQNVFVVTKYSGLDPEINGGIDNTIYPRPRMIALGINLDF
ncbi:MAG TPA: SusC/RagA family TonB-linked outer membrane protein [Chitinophagaceae bacterium]|nr:SusC/RagA family TonB-linked outer membrane protein [Chitinophagaceae bacterium]